MSRRLILPMIGAAWLLGGCATAPPPPPAAIAGLLVLGMSRSDLLKLFGPPIRRERLPEGREDWIYHIGSQTQDSKTTTDSKNIPFGHTYSYSHTSTTTTTMSEQPIHLSSAGLVVAPVPTGQVILP
jgi:hypothetical protein